jgi:hypothetical protein
LASTITLQSIVNYARSYPDTQLAVGASGYALEPSITIANDVMQKFLATGMDWKFNRAYIPPFLTVELQQDYVTNVTNCSWLEFGSRLDINNTAQPKPFFSLETVRDTPWSSYQANAFQVSWIPNSLAVMGTWQANTSYPCGYGQAQTPTSPIQQFIDANGNILFINSASLNLSVNSPGVGASNFVAPGSPYGISGNTQPVLPANSAAGTTVVDGTVTWTVASPNAVAIHLGTVPPTSGLTWLLYIAYQMKPPILTVLNTTLAPIPDEYVYLFRQGFLAYAYDHAGSPKAQNAYIKFEENLMDALKSADREFESNGFYPGTSITGGSNVGWNFAVGPAWPFQYDFGQG